MPSKQKRRAPSRASSSPAPVDAIRGLVAASNPIMRPAGLGEGYVSDLQLSPLLGVPVPTLRRWRILGDGPPYVKFSKTVKYDLRAVQAWIDARPTGGNGIPSSAVQTGGR